MARITYAYEAIDPQGAVVKNEIEALSEKEVVRDLARRDLLPLEIVPKRSSISSSASRILPQREPSKRDFALALKQFSLLLKAGLPLIQATDSLKRQAVHPGLLGKFESIARRLRSGEDFSSSFAQEFEQIPSYAHRMAEAGEATGRLSESLMDASLQMEYEVKIAQSTRNALIYPSILMAAGLGAIVFIFIVVVPRFAEMVTRSEVELPFISRVVFGLGELFNNYMWLFAFCAAVALAGITAAFKVKAVRQGVRNLAARLPLIGPWLREAEIARWAMLMSAMLRNGIELIKALTLAKAAIGISGMRAQFEQAEKTVRSGGSLSASLQEHNALPSIALSLVEVGEDAGELPDMLTSVGELYEESGRQRMTKALALIEPAAILFLGIVVGTIVTAVMLALTSINQISI